MEKQSVMVCITAQYGCLKIIEAAKKAAKNLNADIRIVTIQPKKASALERSRDMKCLYELSRLSSHEIMVRYSNNPQKSLVLYASEIRPIHIFTGTPDGKSKTVSKLIFSYGEAPLSVVGDSLCYTVPAGKELSFIKENKNR